jgi:hypothetical protein
MTYEGVDTDADADGDRIQQKALRSTRVELEPIGVTEHVQRYRVMYAGEVLAEGRRNPIFDACRALLARGITGRLEVWRRGKTSADMQLDIEKGAGLMIRETATVSQPSPGARLMTYDDAADADADRAQQKSLLVALNAWDRALCRDECGAWTLVGKQGSIHTWGDGKSWVLFVACRSAKGWTNTKRRLSFCTVTQDCQDEGCLRLHELPTPEQARVIRDDLGIRKRMEFSPEDLERRRASMTRAREGKTLPSAIARLPTPRPKKSPS